MGYVRIYKLASGEILVNFPAPPYQTIHEETGEDQCPLPHRLAASGEVFELEIMSQEAFGVIEEECRTNGTTVYYDEEGELKSDIGWNNTVMFLDLVIFKRLKRLSGWVSAELAKETPDVLQIFRWKAEQERLMQQDKLTALEVYQIALDSLQYAPTPKPIIQQKLEAKILELQATPDLLAFPAPQGAVGA